MRKEIILKKIVNGVTAMTKCVVENNVNSTCTFLTHQPKLPKGADKLKKS